MSIPQESPKKIWWLLRPYYGAASHFQFWTILQRKYSENWQSFLFWPKLFTGTIFYETVFTGHLHFKYIFIRHPSRPYLWSHHDGLLWPLWPFSRFWPLLSGHLMRWIRPLWVSNENIFKLQMTSENGFLKEGSGEKLWPNEKKWRFSNNFPL